MGTARRQFTEEFKREAVGLLASSGRPLSQIAQELGIASSRLRAWRNRKRGAGGIAAAPNTQAVIPPAGADLAAENARLKRCAFSRKRRDEIASYHDQREMFPVRGGRPSIRSRERRPRRMGS